MNPVFEAAGATLELHRADSNDARHIPLCDFFLGDRRVSMAEDEVLVAIHIPLPKSSDHYFIRAYKQSRRREDSKGIVSAGFRVELEEVNGAEHQWKIKRACFAFGGMSSRTISAVRTQQQLAGLAWTKETIQRAYDLLLEEMPLDETSPGGQPQYRYMVLLSETTDEYCYSPLDAL